MWLLASGLSIADIECVVGWGCAEVTAGAISRLIVGGVGVVKLSGNSSPESESTMEIKLRVGDAEKCNEQAAVTAPKMIHACVRDFEALTLALP